MTRRMGTEAPPLEGTDLSRGIYRRIYAGFLTGRRLNSVSLEAEAWFWRIHALADDWGNTYGDPTVLRAIGAPLRNITADQVAAWTEELSKAGLVRFYAHAGETYLHVVGFQDRQPAGKSGRRIQKHPREVESCGIQGNPGESCGIQGNPGESCGIQGNPVASGKSKPSHSHSHSQKTSAPEGAGNTGKAPETPQDDPDCRRGGYRHGKIVGGICQHCSERVT